MNRIFIKPVQEVCWAPVNRIAHFPRFAHAWSRVDTACGIGWQWYVDVGSIVRRLLHCCGLNLKCIMAHALENPLKETGDVEKLLKSS